MSTRYAVWRKSTHLFLFTFLLVAFFSSISHAGNAIVPPPTLWYPMSAQKEVSLQPYLYWNSSTGAMAYTVQISRNLSFTDLVVTADNIVTTYFFLATPLQPGTYYYWRVRAVNGTSVSPWSPIWGFTTTVYPTPDSAPTLTAPADNATAVPSPPVLTWEAVTNAASYTVQYTMDSTFKSGITTIERINTTNYTLKSLIPSRVYYWRVRAVNGPQVSDWSTIWSFTAPAITLTAPLLYSPKNGMANATVSPYLSWAETAGAQGYRVQISTEPTFATYAYDKAVATRIILVSDLQPNTTYYWRVQGYTAVPGAWSAVWSFNTGYLPSAMPMIPILALPLNGTLGASVNPLLTWNTSNGAISYTLQLAEDASFETGVITYALLTNTSQQVNGLRANTCYYWRVNATNAAGTTAWSPIWHLTTQPTYGTVPDAPVPLSPNDLTNNISLNPRLYWTTVKNTVTYTVQLARNAAFTEGCITLSTASTSIQFTGLLGNTRYFWHIQAVNNDGAGNWSTTRSFATQTPYGYTPATPALLTPTNGAANQLFPISLTWLPADRATSYNVQLALNSSFTTGVITRTQVIATRLAVTGLASGKRYYWRVQAVNGAGMSPWSAIWSFTTSPTTQLTQLN